MEKLINQDDRFFVAGHRGMAGSAICRALKRNGYKNLLVANRDELDLLDNQAVQSWFEVHRPAVVILAAAKVGGIYANQAYPADFLLENLKIQNNVIEAAWISGVKRFLFLGSSCIYPKFAKQPIREESLLTGTLESTNEWYAIAKIAGIKLCDALRKQHEFDAICLMPTNLYGPGDNYHPKNSHVLPALIRRFYESAQCGADSVTCWGSGAPLREFLHVDDLGDACIFALKYWKPSIEESPLLNVGTGVDISIRDLARLVAKQTGFEGSIIWDSSKPDGTPKKQLDVSKFGQLGWKSSITLEHGLKTTIESFKSQLSSQSARL